MPIDDLTALGQKMREARKNKELTQQELSDLSHVSVKQIANIEKGKMNPSYLILRALAKVLHISLDTLINPDISLEDEGVNQMKMLYSSCPPEMRDTLLHHTQETVKELTEFLSFKKKSISIQVGIAISFTVVALFAMGAFGITMYHLFTDRMEAMMSENAVQLLDQTATNLESYLKNMRRISDTMYYSVIKDKDLASEDMVQEMNLLYDANKENLVSIACYTSNGNLVEAVPVAGEKEDVDVTEQEWFREAVGKMENFHFSTPHVQNLFDDANYRYHWVISLSRAVELTKGGDSELGVLLVDMNYSSIEQLLEKANTGINEEYVYLMDGNGEIIYHPKQKLIYAGLYEENNEEIAAWDDGSHKEDLWSENRLDAGDGEDRQLYRMEDCQCDSKQYL